VKKILAADLFCGAGGTSTGLRQACDALGLRLDLVAVNHWPIAIDTHSLNHPDVKHVCAAIESVEPRQVVPSGRLDLLVASRGVTDHVKNVLFEATMREVLKP
jgi:DNA (cytosine-5)-methyltransferase 1